MSLFDKLFKPKPDKWQVYLNSRPIVYFGLTPKPEIKLDRNFAVCNAQHYYRQFNESMNLIETTKKPDVFFSRYDCAATRIIGLIYMQKYAKKKNNDLEKIATSLIENKQLFVERFIERAFDELKLKVHSLKTQKAKINNIEKFQKSFEPYFVEMSAQNKDYMYSLTDGLKHAVEMNKEWYL